MANWSFELGVPARFKRELGVKFRLNADHLIIENSSKEVGPDDQIEKSIINATLRQSLNRRN